MSIGAGRVQSLVAKTKGSAMSLSYNPTIDDLLADSLVQTVMRADQVEPQTLKTMLYGVASRIERPERALQRPAAVFVSSAGQSRTPSRSWNAGPTARRAGRVRHSGSGSVLCC
jgi:hypothetical protein